MPVSNVIAISYNYGGINSVTIVDGGSGIVVGAIYEIGFGSASSKAYVEVTAVTLGVATEVKILYSGIDHSTQTNRAYRYSGTGSSYITLSWVAANNYTNLGYYDFSGFVATQLASGRTIKQISKDQKVYLNGVDFTQWQGFIQSVTGSGLTFIRAQKLILWT
jgi:hypothetical protein